MEVTANHPIYVEGQGWVDAEDLAAGDRLRRQDDGWAQVLAIERVLLDAPVMVYNFTVQGVHTYFVLEVGVLVHNCGDTKLLPEPSGLLALEVHGIRTQRIIHGHNGIVAIIGRSMGDFKRRGVYGVVDYARQLRAMGYKTELFAGNLLSKKARNEIAELSKEFSDGMIPDHLIPHTRAYTENVRWAKKIKREGYTAIDIGDPNGNGFSPFYFAEKGIIFGDDF